MRTIAGDVTVRLYHLDETDPIAHTLFYGPLDQAMILAAQQPEEVQSGLWLATDNDVIAWLDLVE